MKLLSCVRLCATPWTAAHQAPPSMGFSRQEYWSRVPLPSPNGGTILYYSICYHMRMIWVFCVCVCVVEKVSSQVSKI